MVVNLLYHNWETDGTSLQSGAIAPNRNLSNEALTRDLKLELLLDAMADDDMVLKRLCKKVLLHPSLDPLEISFRQNILKDAMKTPEFFYEIYRSAYECLELTAVYNELHHPRYAKIIPSMKKVISYSETANLYVKHLESISDLIAINYPLFHSERMIEFCNDFNSDYTKPFLGDLQSIIEQLLLLKQGTKITIGGHLGIGLKMTDIVLHNIVEEADIRQKDQTYRFFSNTKNKSVIMLDNNRLAGHSEEMMNASFTWLLKTLSNFTNECKTLFEVLREMFGFYTGALRLYEQIEKTGTKITFPEFNQIRGQYEFIDLMDLGLILKEGKNVVGNSLSILDKNLCIITGSNQGGKTTFLRSVGLAQLMAQSGLFVTAASFNCCIYKGIFTHFPNEEDKELCHGLLEEELSKLDHLVLQMQPGSLLLMNESFSTTIEYDASILAEEITTAFIKCGITVFFVTHLYDYAHKLYLSQQPEYEFLRAGRNDDGSRTYRIETGEPLKSSFALDLYHEIFTE